MILFVYGTLLHAPTLAVRSGDPSLLKRRQPASLHGWRRVRLRRTRYPTLRRAPRDRVEGAIIPVSAAAFRHLTAYEGPAYRVHRVTVTASRRAVPAWTWIASGGTKHPWTQRRTLP